MNTQQKAIEAEAKAARWLGELNRLIEGGKAKSYYAERAEKKAQFWLDRANVLRGNN